MRIPKERDSKFNFILFGYTNLKRKPLFGNEKYDWGALPIVREVFLNLAMYQEIGVKPHCIINVGL